MYKRFYLGHIIGQGFHIYEAYSNFLIRLENRTNLETALHAGQKYIEAV